MPTRPGYIWSGTEWVSIGQEAVVAPVSYQASAPSTPSTGDIWIDSNDDVPGIDTSQFLRWRKTAVGGETSVSGTDDNGLTLAYTANYEQVYLNGVLLVRGQDYTATNGTSITGLTALAANDVVEVFGVVARVVGDVYTQAQTNSLLDAKSNVSSTGAVLVASATFTSATTVSFNNCFTSAYSNYFAVYNMTTAPTTSINMRYRVGGVDNTSTGYIQGGYWLGVANASAFGSTNNATYSYVGMYTGNTTYGAFGKIEFIAPFETNYTKAITWGAGYDFGAVGSIFNATTSFDGFTLYNSTASNMTGTIKVYGYK